MVLLAPQANASAPSLKVVASSAADGPIVQGLSVGMVLELVADYAVDYQAFLSLSATLVNTHLVQAETAQPEGTPMQLVLTGLTDPLTGGSIAGRLAAGVNQDWSQGKIRYTDGELIPAWSGASQIAYANDQSATLTLQWVKGQPWVWVIVGVLLAIAAVSLYRVLAHGGYTLSAASSLSKAVISAGSLLIKNWPITLGVAAVLVTAPFVVRHVAEAREAVNEERYAAKGGF